ncbi:YafY family protein [Nocardioides sp. CFH 31398]|uniref:helix-turn-helix transcriptional regulator n=1 Tax=Nocardioides sp. CFH 31398 TaxID=2919579 RepID=UPI001F06F5DC|nr:WYL domain-containing protein [Nocardioides sp. CFH 31398]MCH1866375.1 WYL domain-containing protein [Nocardioides sp. CFH 31398]
MEADVAARTLMLLTLLSSRPTWEAADLAERCGTSPRTLRRDIRRLVALGYAVRGRPGPGGHYRLAPGTRLPPLLFDDEEVLALVVGLRSVERGATAEAAQRALTKLRQVLPRRLASVADDAAATSETVTLDPGAAFLLGPLTAAAAADRSVSFTYTDRHGATSRRHADSLRCLLVDGRWCVLARDRDRENWRLFLVARLTDLETGAAAPRQPLPADDLAHWLRTDFGRAGESSRY